MMIEITKTILEVPMAPEAEIKTGYSQRFVQLRLTPAQADVLRRLRRGAAASGERLASGREVATPPQAIQWLLEQITAA